VTASAVQIVVVMRHAEPVSSMEDATRPLSVVGRRQADLMASWIAAAGVMPEEVRTSNRLRAKQTADVLARRLGLPPGRSREWNALAPDADPAVAAADLGSDAQRVVLVGHLPHVERLVSTLVTGEPTLVHLEMNYASAVVLTKTGERWAIRAALGPADVLALDQDSRGGYRVST
jgi:phosphohistidine phosphatase